MKPAAPRAAPPRLHPFACHCADCRRASPPRRNPTGTRALRLLSGGIIGIGIVLILAAAGGPSPLVIIGQ